MRIGRLQIHTLDLAIAGALLVAAELATGVGDYSGSAAALYLLPLAWTLPFAVRRQFPSVTALTVLGALALESLAAQKLTESLVVLVVYTFAFWTAGTIPDRGRALSVGIAGTVFGVAIVARNPGAVHAGDVVFIVIASALPFAAGFLLRSREQHADELERDREVRARAAVEEERARIARELHDVVGHAVGVMTVQAGAARLMLDREPERSREAMLAVEDAGRQALAEMRRMLEVLRTDGEKGPGRQPALSDLEELVAQMRDTGLPVELVVEGEPSSLSPGLGLATYRIVQEALTNVLKHAPDTRAAVVRVCYRPGGLDLEVENDGAVLAAGDLNGGHGLYGMRERVALYGGELTAGARAEGGFAVRVHLPTSPAES